MNIPSECYPPGYFTGPGDMEIMPCALCGDYYHISDMAYIDIDYICKTCLKNEEDKYGV